jgi:hypothetical protein
MELLIDSPLCLPLKRNLLLPFLLICCSCIFPFASIARSLSFFLCMHFMMHESADRALDFCCLPSQLPVTLQVTAAAAVTARVCLPEAVIG